jgi:hypothetical protein
VLLLSAAAVPAGARTEVTALPPPSPSTKTVLVPGITYERQVRDGGQVVHILRVRPGARQSVRPILAGGSPSQRGSVTGAVASRRAEGAVAAMNGDFFNFEHANPSGLLLSGGELVSEPEAGRSSLVFQPDRLLAAARLAFAGTYETVDPAGIVPPRSRRIDAMNRPAILGSETILFTPAYGQVDTPTGDSLFEARIRLDEDRPFLANEVRGGTVIATGAGGGMTIGAGHAVVTGVGSAGRNLARELAPGQRVNLATGVTGLPPGAADAIGGGPLLVSNGQAVHAAGEGFSGSQLYGRTSRSAVAQTVDGTILLVTAEGPQQGSPGLTVAEQADLMAALGARVAIGMDGGGSAQLAVGDDLVIPWDSPRRVSTALLVAYQGLQLSTLPFRISPNGDGVDDRAGVVVAATAPGRTKVALVARPGNEATVLFDGPLGPGEQPIRIDPLRLEAADGVYEVVARQVPDDGSPPTTQRRRVIVDRTLASLTARPTKARVGKKRRPVLDVGFRLVHQARVTVEVRTPSGTVLKRLSNGRVTAAGRHSLRWGRRAGGERVDGAVEVVVIARTKLGQSGLQRSVGLAKP